MEDDYSVIEWTIENFSCWNSEIHSNKISLPQIDFSSAPKEERFLKVFPRGATGKEDNLVVKIYNPWSSGDCELSFISSNGYLIQTETQNVKKEYSKVFIGPSYQKVVTLIRENEPRYKDTLTLRVRTKFRVVAFNRHSLTILEVFKTSLKLNSAMFKERDIEIGMWDRISNIQYPIDEGKEKNIYVYAKVGTREDVKMESGQKVVLGPRTPKSRDDMSVKLMLRSHGENTEKALAQISLSFHFNDKVVSKNGMDEHIFTGKDEWIYPKSMTVKELMKNTHYILLKLKMILGNTPKTYSHWSRYPEETELSLTSTETTTHPEVNSSSPSSSASKYLETLSTDVLTKQMLRLFLNKEFSDMEIRCQEVTFPVHRGILSTRSPVFKKLLTEDMSELQQVSSKLLVIEDLDTSTVTRFLAFLYSGSLEDLQWESALKLYYAAEKYQVPTLKRECVNVMSAEISVSNVCEILSMADKYPDDQLRSAAHDFILKNYNRVLKSKEWKNFMAVDPNLLLKTVTLFAEFDYVGKMNEP